MFIDFGTALRAGTENYYKNKDFLENKRRLQEELTMQKKSREILDKSRELQNERLQLELNQLKKNLIKNDTYSALDRYSIDKDPKHINRLIKNPEIQKLWTDDPNNPPIHYEHPSDEKDFQAIAVKYDIDLDTVKENKDLFLKQVQADGTIEYFPEDTLYSLTGWFQHADEQRLKRLKEEYELRGTKSYRKTELERVAEIRAKQAEGQELSYFDKAFLDAYSEKEKSALDKKLDGVGKSLSEVFDISNSYLKNEMTIPEKAFPSLLKFQEKYGSKLPDTVAKEVTSSIPILQIGTQTLKKLESMGPDDFAAGAVDVGIQKIGQLLSDKNFLDLAPAEKEKVLKNTQIRSDLGYMLAKFVQSISGAAVTEAEFQRLKDVITTGEYSNKYVLSEALQSFLKKVKLTNETQLKSYFNEAPYQVASKWNRLAEIKIPEISRGKEFSIPAQEAKSKTQAITDTILDPLKEAVGLDEDKQEEEKKRNLFRQIVEKFRKMKESE